MMFFCKEKRRSEFKMPGSMNLDCEFRHEHLKKRSNKKLFPDLLVFVLLKC